MHYLNLTTRWKPNTIKLMILYIAENCCCWIWCKSDESQMIEQAAKTLIIIIIFKYFFKGILTVNFF